MRIRSASNRLGTRRQEPQNLRSAQRKNATFESEIYDSELALALFDALTFRAKKFLQTLLTLVNQFVLILKNALSLAAFGTKQISRRNRLLITNFISNIDERFFHQIKNYRHIANRYDKLALCFENFVLIDSSRILF